MRKLLYLVILTFVASCSPRVFPSTEIRDSIKVEIRERLVHDTITFNIQKEVERVIVRDSLSHLENEYALSDASIDSLGYLHHSLETKDKLVYVPYAVTVTDTLYVEKSIMKKFDVYRLTWWQQTQIKLFWILALIDIVVLFVIILKIKF